MSLSFQAAYQKKMNILVSDTPEISLNMKYFGGLSRSLQLLQLASLPVTGCRLSRYACVGFLNVLSGTEQPSFIFTHIVPVSVSACRSTFPNKQLFPSSELHATGVHSWSCSVAPSTLAPVPPNASWRAGCMQSIFALPCTCSLLPSAILLAWLMLRMPEVWFRLPVSAQLFLPAGR